MTLLGRMAKPFQHHSTISNNTQHFWPKSNFFQHYPTVSNIAQQCSKLVAEPARSVNKNINKIQERALRIAYKDGCSSFEDLLRKAESVSIHQRNVKLLATEIFKTQSNFNPSFMKQIFGLKDIPYHLLSCRNILAPKPKTTGYGIESA